MSDTLKVLTSTTGNRTDNWNTPNEFIIDILKFFDNSIDLDPCSDHIGNIPAKKRYTKEEDGLSHEWIANKVYMNHPYSESKRWIPYAVNQYKKGNAKELILLIKLDVSTKWWNYVANYPWIAVNKRLKFGNSSSAAPFQSAIVYLGINFDRFKDVFRKYGNLYISV